MTEHQQGTASKSSHVHKWVDKALLHEPPLKVCACGATMTDNEYRDSPKRDERDRAAIPERVRCHGCGRRRLVAVWLDLGNWMCAALCGACAKETESNA